MTAKTASLALSIVATVLALSGTAKAQECPRTSSPEQARQLAGRAFTEGQRLFEHGDMRAALDQFRCSYSLVPHHNTLFNMAECAESLGNLEVAIRYFHTYLEDYPDVEGRAEVETRLRALEARQAATRPPPRVETDGGAAPPPTGPVTRMTLARRLAWVTLGVGAGLAIVGGGVYGGAVSRNTELRDTNEDYLDHHPAGEALSEDEVRTLEELADSGSAMEGAGWALMGIGLASLAASVVLFTVFDGTEPATGSARGARRLALAVSPLVLGESGGGLSIAGQY
jgi:tetratricopeptide (TPR) repeat protein